MTHWNPSEDDYPKNICLHKLVELQVAKTPEAVALCLENAQISYQELNGLANQLARYLQSLGVKPGMPVAICMDLGLDLAVAVLGIIKAGGALAPLDPNFPRQRSTDILEDVQAALLVTQKRFVNETFQQLVQLVCVDDIQAEIALHSQANLEIDIPPESLAYILYTSGSTGKPKGVMLSHYVCCTRELWEQKAFELNAADRVLLKSSWSSREFFWPLMIGATVVIPRPEGNRDVAYLVSLLAQQQITVISAVPSLLKALLAQANIQQCSHLRYVLCSGEALPMQVQQAFFAAELKAELWNIYGLNEANYAAFWQCERYAERATVPIGRPTDLQIYLLDEHLQPAPIGDKAEIYISGVGLSSGYYKRPDLTAERFTPNVFNNGIGMLFKTGDIGRYAADGVLEYLGRMDNQVKIRGNRVELEEIEIALKAHPSVAECVVVCKEDAVGENRLLAYVVPDKSQSVNSKELRRYLDGKLPEFMAPTAFIALDGLALTFNGKINRLALPEPVWESLFEKAEFVAPSSAIEQQVANSWSQVLKVEHVGKQDHFFFLGGHSLLATQVIASLNLMYQIELSLRDIYEAPTVAELAERIDLLCWASQAHGRKIDPNVDETAAREEFSF